MIKIAYDHQIFGFQEYGGVSRYFYEIGKRVCLSAGFSATMVAPLYVNRYLEEGGVKVIGFRVRQIPKTNRIINATNQLISSAIFKICPLEIGHET